MNCDCGGNFCKGQKFKYRLTYKDNSVEELEFHNNEYAKNYAYLKDNDLALFEMIEYEQDKRRVDA